MERDAVDWFDAGFDLHHSGDYDKAIQCYDHALEIDPEDTDAWRDKGGALAKLGRYDEAIQCYDHALEIDPEDTDAWFWKASAWDSKGLAVRDSRYDEAILCFDRASEIRSRSAAKQNNALSKKGATAKDTSKETLRKTVNIKSRTESPHPGEAGELPESPAPPVEPIKTSLSITIERTIYDPLIQNFIISSSRPLVNVRDWIDRHDPSSYWLVICVQNHGNHPIDEWGIELDSSSTLQILETAIEGSDEQVRLQFSNPKPWLIKSLLGVPHQRGIVIPRGGSRRVYFRLGSESCGISHSIKGRFITSDTEVEIREKQFQHSCDVATLGVAIQQDPKIAVQYAENALVHRYHREIARNYLHTFRLIQEIDTFCRAKRFEDVHDKLYVLEDALDKMGVSERLVGLVKQLNELDIDDGMGGSMLELKAQRAEKICKTIVDVWTTEVLTAPRC